jgi:hypothetical protein
MTVRFGSTFYRVCFALECAHNIVGYEDAGLGACDCCKTWSGLITHYMGSSLVWPKEAA